MKITDERLVFCNTPQPTIYVVEIKKFIKVHKEKKDD